MVKHWERHERVNDWHDLYLWRIYIFWYTFCFFKRKLDIASVQGHLDLNGGTFSRWSSWSRLFTVIFTLYQGDIHSDGSSILLRSLLNFRLQGIFLRWHDGALFRMLFSGIPPSGDWSKLIFEVPMDLLTLYRHCSFFFAGFSECIAAARNRKEIISITWQSQLSLGPFKMFNLLTSLSNICGIDSIHDTISIEVGVGWNYRMESEIPL
jgi:hypothetical protein